MRFDRVAQTKRGTPRAETFTLDQFYLGINTAEPATKLLKGEMIQCKNMVLSRSRSLKTRFGLEKITNSALSSPAEHIYHVPVGDTFYTLAVTQDGKLYYLDSSQEPVLIKDLETQAEIVSFHNAAMILDGSYLKVWDGDSVFLAYDDGEGKSGCQIYQLDKDYDADITLDDSTTRAGIEFTTQDWDDGYTIPITKVRAYLKKEDGATPAGEVSAKIYLKEDDSEVAASTNSYDADGLPNNYTELSFDFDKSEGFDPETEYYAVIEYTGQDSGDKVYLGTEETTDSDGNAVTYDDSWASDSDKFPRMSVQPGRPPKASFGTTYSMRLFLVNPDEPGRLYFSNVNTYQDFSTSEGGGWIGVVDDAANSYAIGAIVSQYERLFVFGTDQQPFLCALQGESPSDYALAWIMGQVVANRHTTISVGNNVFFSNPWGTRSLSGVQEYGDVRTMEASGGIRNLFDRYWGNDAFAGFEPADGLYLLQLPGRPELLAAHTVIPAERRGAQVYPWTEIVFAKHQLVGSGFAWHKSASGENEYYVTDEDGNDPGIYEPQFLFVADRQISQDSIGGLSNLNWGYGDNDDLDFDTVYVCMDEGNPDEVGHEILMPLDASALGTWNGRLYVAGHDGHIYAADHSITRDNEVDPRYLLQTPYITGDFEQFSLERIGVQAYSRVGGRFELSIYQNQQFIHPAITLNMNMGIDEDVTVDDLSSMLVKDAEFYVVPTPTPAVSTWFNLICYQFMLSIQEMQTRGWPIFIESITLRVRRLK